MLNENLDIEYIYELLNKQEQRILIQGKTKAKYYLLIIRENYTGVYGRFPKCLGAWAETSLIDPRRARDTHVS